MLRSLNFGFLAILFGFCTTAAWSTDIGRVATPEEVALWDIDVRPDGQGLPEGQGTVEEGDAVFAERCAHCHGDFGEGIDRWPVLAGGQGSLKNQHPVKTIGSYWPYLSTVYDYIRRAMPFGEAQTLSPDELYAVTAYLLNVNGLFPDDGVLSKENFASVRLPNEDGFIMDDRAETEWGGKARISNKVEDLCMKNCKSDVKVTGAARIIDVTPEEDDS